ncbi:hypothetical protein HPULCUR_005700 [Helicostylum pulchrum]|uniref:DUF7905 domain-containing protein n=1 Tax=Helicostylum pulchrum TaxID=562976 RepID=A0ABP9XZU1_9FUNG
MTLLLPQLNKFVDENKFEGTFEDLESMSKSVHVNPSSSGSADNNTPTRTMVGRPLNLEEVDKKHNRSRESITGSTEAIAAPTTPNAATPTTPTAAAPEREAYYRYETESDEPDDSDEEYVETFTFAKNIANPKDVLTGPPSNNSKPPDYLRIIGNDTETECSLQGRSIKIVGTCEESIKEAADRFRNLQTTFKRRKRPTNIVPCVHYPTESPRFGLYFCPLERYAHQDYVYTAPGSQPLYVMLPVFKDKNGQEQKPKDLLTAPPQNQPPQWMSQKKPEQDLSLEDRMRLATLEHKKKGLGNVNAGLAPDQTPLWGENKNYVVRPSASAVVTPVTPTPRPAPVVQKRPEENFPSLGSSSAPPPRPTIKKPTKNTRRVLRVVSQKSPKASPSPAPPPPAMSNLDIVREYNLGNIKTALTDGLNSIRGFKGTVKLNAKLGKVLWTNLSPDIQKKVWDFYDVKDILMEGHKVLPRFNNVTTQSEEVIASMSDFLPDPYSRSAYFEMYADARNQPTVEYDPVVMYMSQGVVELKKVVTNTTKVTEIDWVSLDRKFDFQLLLKTEQTTRTDVKPYTTFIKKVAVCPNTRQITFENVPDFLQMKSILLKQTTKYRIHFPFVIEITRVEKIPLSKQKLSNYGIAKIQGDTGKGQVWYDLEVYYSTHDGIFKSNHDLPVGKLASWTVEDVLGSDNDASVALVEYIRCLLLFVEKCEAAV